MCAKKESEEMIEITIPFPPYSGNNYKGRAKNGGVFVKPEITKFQRDVYYLVRLAKLKAFIGPAEIHLHVFEPNRRARDADNVMKPTFDALQFGRLIEKDSQFRRVIFDFDEDVKKDGEIIVRIKEWKKKTPFWAW